MDRHRKKSTCLASFAQKFLAVFQFRPAIILTFHYVCLPWILICYKSPIIDVPGVANADFDLPQRFARKPFQSVLMRMMFLNWSSVVESFSFGCIQHSKSAVHCFSHFEPCWARLEMDIAVSPSEQKDCLAKDCGFKINTGKMVSKLTLCSQLCP